MPAKKREPTLEQRIGRRMRQLRGERKLREVDEIAQLGIQKLSRLERGEAENPTLSTLAQVARGLNVDVEALFTTTTETAYAEAPSRDPQRIHPALRQFVDRLVETPAAGSWQGDVLEALAALTRALQRGPDSGTVVDAPPKTGR